MNDPLRVAHEGPFWASMFLVLGLVVGFGGTMEVIRIFMKQGVYVNFCEKFEFFFSPDIFRYPS